MELQITAALIAIIVLMLFLLRQRLEGGRSEVYLRPLSGFQALKGQVGRAIESGRQLHVTLGQASLIGTAAPTSVAAGRVLDDLAKDGCANSTPPLVTVGEGTLLPLAQDSLRHAYEAAERKEDIELHQAVFVAHDTDRFAYAGGVSVEVLQGDVISSVLVGRLGPELILMTDAGSRKEVEQVVGTDDPVALAVAAAATDNLLIGEELLAAGAYLEGSAGQLATLQLQDILRWIIALVMLGIAVYQFVIGM